MPPTIPTNAVLKDMPDADVAKLAQAYGIEAADRDGQIKALKAARQAAVQGAGAGADTAQTLPTIPDDAGLAQLNADQIADLLKANGLPGLASRAEDESQLRAKRDAAPVAENHETLGAKTSGAFEGDTGTAGAGSQAGTGAGPSDQDQSGITRDVTEDSAEFVFELGSKVFLFERNHDPETSEVREGYQAPKPGKIAKITDGTDVIDVLTGGEDSAAITSHDVAHETHAKKAGANYWSETAE